MRGGTKPSPRPKLTILVDFGFSKWRIVAADLVLGNMTVLGAGFPVRGMTRNRRCIQYQKYHSFHRHPRLQKVRCRTVVHGAVLQTMTVLGTVTVFGTSSLDRTYVG